jgi:integrase
MREVIPEIRLKTTRFRGGERFPVLLDKRGLPLCEPISYLAGMRHQAVNTLEGKARTLAMVHNFFRAYEIDFRTRLPEGRVLEQFEASALRHHLRTIGRRTETIHTRKRSKQPDYQVKEIVEAHEWQRRRLWVADYLEWLVHGLIHKLALPPNGSQRIIAELKKARVLVAKKGGRAAKPAPAALSVEQGFVLLDAIRPGSEANPFPEVHQFRNLALILTYWDTGLRRSEVLTLKGEDLSARGRAPALNLVRRPNDPDELRSRPPSVKTMPRRIPITPILHGVLMEYIERHRRAIAVAKTRREKQALNRLKSNPYIFVSSQGTALSFSGVHKIFDRLRMQTIDLPVNLSPHTLRRTWNDLFLELRGDKLGPRETQLREFLMGWVRGSAQSDRYAWQSTEREASRAIVDQQREWMAMYREWKARREELNES